MKAILISGKPKWTALIMNGKKTDEIRKNKGLYKAIQKLIDEYGYADIYWYCSKNGGRLYQDFSISSDYYYDKGIKDYQPRLYNGKVVFKFRCYKIDDYVYGKKWSWKIGAPLDGISNDYEFILKKTCLTDDELRNYCDDLCFYDIHISDLEIFDEPKEISEFWVRYPKEDIKFDGVKGKLLAMKPLTKAPQNFCYVEVE